LRHMYGMSFNIYLCYKRNILQDADSSSSRAIMIRFDLIEFVLLLLLLLLLSQDNY
jgi:hypothetical protein